MSETHISQYLSDYKQIQDLLKKHTDKSLINSIIGNYIKENAEVLFIGYIQNIVKPGMSNVCILSSETIPWMGGGTWGEGETFSNLISMHEEDGELMLVPHDLSSMSIRSSVEDMMELFNNGNITTNVAKDAHREIYSGATRVLLKHGFMLESSIDDSYNITISRPHDLTNAIDIKNIPKTILKRQMEKRLKELDDETAIKRDKIMKDYTDI